MHTRGFLISTVFALLVATKGVVAEDLSNFKRNQTIAGFRVGNLYTDSNGKIVGAKFWHILSDAPIYVLQIETAPQTFMWVDTPATSNRGVAHSLEHILARKGTKGRYLSLLRVMRLSQSGAATYQDYNMYCLTSGTGMAGFIEQFHALIDALFRPDFSDVEAEREFYHFGISSDPTTREKRLVEQGTVYNEMRTGEGIYTYYFGLNKQVFGGSNPFAFNVGGTPDAMRDVTPAEIRQFHAEHYRLGPGTGFIFVFPPKENVTRFLARISEEFERIPRSGPDPTKTSRREAQPKYALAPSTTKEIKLYPFPASSDADRSEIRLGWAAARAESQVELRLRQLLLRALADGEQSLLYKSLIDSKTKELDSEASSIEAEVFLENSPWWPAEFIALRGIPGNHISVDMIERFRQHILSKIGIVSAYQENSQELLAFNQLVLSYAKAWQRDQRVWIKSSPLFSSQYKTDWKEHLNYLEMDPSFVRSLSDKSVWETAERQIESGKNLWREVINKSHLLETPYATASVPSPRLLTEMKQEKQRRIQNKLQQLEKNFGISDEQEALARYEQSELKKTAEIDKIESQVARPEFTERPPLTPDDDIQYKQFHLNTVPVIAVLFDGTPTIDVGLSFDLRKIPSKYYKYLPILPRCFDSLGLKTPHGVTSYSGLLAETQRDFSAFSIEYDSNPVSARADLAIRASTGSPQDLQRALTLISEMLQFSNLEMSNLERLRDLLNERLAEEDRYGKGDDSSWFWNPSDAFRHQDDAIYVAVNSHFTRAHSDSRLKWLIHQPVTPDEIENLHGFAEGVLASLEGLSAQELSARLSQLQLKGLEKELVLYWQRNITSFPEKELPTGLRQLTAEVQHDLTVGAAQAMKELKELQSIIVDRGALKVDITVDPALLKDVKPTVGRFVQSIPTATKLPYGQQAQSDLMHNEAPIMRRIEKRAGVDADDFPWYVGLEDSHSATGGVVFSSDFIGYSQLNRQAFIKMLSSKIASGTGPHTFYMKTVESGLAYSNSVRTDPGSKLLWYYADRVPDIASLVELVNSYAAALPKLDDPSLVDYVLQKTFPFPRSMSTFTDRGRRLARDIYDGNEPAKIRRFSEAILKLRSDPNLQSEIIQSGLLSIAPVLLKPEFKELQRPERSIFFLVGPESLLADAEKRLALPKLLRLYPSDFWMD